MRLYFAYFNLVACDLVRFHLIVILKQNLKKMIFVVFSYILCLLALHSSPGIQLLSFQQFAQS